ncbi:MAG: cytochrome c biogenesis protein CcdA [Candidatus Magasanikbacteria bacterium]|nr:cytochrome c biogenesis protein CcdA [Candidatus Magasanikbacteria bacterium]
MDFGLIISAFVAGLLTFFAPCTFPLVPAYLGFISGVSVKDINSEKERENVRKKIFINGVFYVLGFSFIFILFGVLFGFLGSILSAYQTWLNRVGALFIIFFGLYLVGLFKIPFLQKEKRLNFTNKIKPGKPLSSFIFGMSFAVGWTPCIGPILGSIFILASSSGTVLQGTFLLFVFAFGLALPHLFIALSVGHATNYVRKLSKYLNIISIVGGVFLVFIGILLITNSFAIWTTYFFKLFNFIDYDKLLNYL